MNKQELIEHYEKILDFGFLSTAEEKLYRGFVEKLKQLDEPEPIKLRDVIARIKQLDIGTRKVWLDEFLNDLGSDYGTGLLLSLAYLFVIGLTYAILDYNLADGAIPFLFSISVYVLETLIYLTMLSYVFQRH